MSQELKLSDLTEERVKSIREETTILDGAGEVVGVFVPPDKYVIDPEFPELTLAELERRRKEPSKSWAEVREKLKQL